MRVQHQALTSLTGIEHGFFTRNGGTSSDTYHSLNCGYGSDDDREQVRQNRALVAQTITVADDRLVTAYQVHSPLALAIDGPFTSSQPPKVDALVTNTPGLAVAILTADCGPVLFADPNAGVVAAAHAGWRGAFEGVIQATVEKMLELGAENKNITAILGPTISRDNYEVDTAFKERFIERDSAYAHFFSQGNRDGHMQFNLPAFIVAKLEESNIGTALNINRCTYGEENQFFSFRRSTHRNEPDYGRQISAIALI
ncbi:peptidoglycan editing factor PgeF [Cohaesibacter celericrescens]|uniref:Purine nucleoside phosphorylase n=1 Tax=Cohaesibacter celericrescens TaxID=2067669 RepID=A0A2N5XXB0_9HYPH|nr:peptidoglycan editing factor PgeF [Cohaesibacter celericrescens]PLW79153.1 peptidoglycan editing factor PgeF [Cohaesibacter celericrescens]